MKKCRSGWNLVFVMAAWLLCALSVRATAIVWTNLSGGNWSAATNWSPNLVPSTNDDVFITNGGTYDVSLDISPTINSLTVGGSNGLQTVHTGVSVLTVNNASDISTNGAFDLEGGSFYGPGPMFVSGSFLWTGGYLGGGAPGATVSLAPGAVMSLQGQSYTLYGLISNAGTIFITKGSLDMFGACFNAYGMLINLPGGVVLLDSDANIQALCGSEVVTNFGTVVKYDAPVSPIAAPFYNYGLLDIEEGTISLASTYSLTNGTVNFGIGDLYDYGSLALSGNPAPLAGGITASLMGTYQPIATNIFPVVTYTSASGGFTSTNLPYLDAWATNYSATAFSLVVLNARPMISPISLQTIDETSNLTVYANATEADFPPNTLTFGLSNAPAGMTINASSGLLNWTPTQEQSPSTNVVTVVVTNNGTPPLGTNTSFQVVVVEVNEAPLLPLIGPQTVNDLVLLTVTNTAAESNIHATITGYSLLNPPAGAVISPQGIVTWTPSQSEGPSTNVITTVVTNTDPLDTVNPTLTSTSSFTVVVFGLTLPPPASYTVNVGQTLIFTNAANDNDPTRALTFKLLNGHPPAAAIGSASGIFIWRPGLAYAGTTNALAVRVSVNSTPPLSGTETFTVYVNELSPPVSLAAPEVADGQFQFQISGPLGPTYLIETVSALSGQWTNLATITPAALPFLFTATNSISTSQFYRVQLAP
jgi:hypothetical protein